MRRIIIFLVLIAYCYIVNSQDIIIKNNGDEIEAKVLEVTPELVKYHKFNFLDGPIYSTYISEIFMIKYSNGLKDVFGNKGDDNSGKEENRSSSNKIITDTLLDDRDGNKYGIVKIGEQWWMAENLNHQISESTCYKNDNSKCKECGQLYNFSEALQACPIGWHLPTDKEWNELEINVGMQYIEAIKNGWRGSGSGQAPRLLVGGDTGLDIVLCGYYEHINHYAYTGYHDDAIYWTSTSKNERRKWIRHFKQRASISRSYSIVSDRNSIRCVKDSK